MIDTPPDFPQSPSFLISQLTDPTFVTRICHPFIHREISGDAFSLALVKDALVPGMKDLISKNDIQAMKLLPEIAKLLVDNLEDEGLRLLQKEVLPSLYRSLTTGNSKHTEHMMSQIAEILCRVSSRFRDNLLVDVIASNCAQNETRLRALAAYLVPFVRDSKRVLPYFRQLSLDRVPSVRIEVIKSLPMVQFDDELKQYIVLGALHDKNIQIANAAAVVFGDVCPQCLDEFLPLLRDPNTVRMALRSVKAIVIESGLHPVINDFRIAMEMQPDLSAAVVINLLKNVDDTDLPLLVDAAKHLRMTKNVIKYLQRIVDACNDPSIVVDFLDPSGVHVWRIRAMMLGQCMNYVGIVESAKMISLASKFADDETAIIREKSVELWAKLIKSDHKTIVSVKKWIGEKWQLRLSLTKVIGRIGEEVPAFTDTIRILSQDPVSSVRCSMARVLVQHQDVDLFNELFKDSTDVEVQHLFQSLHTS